MGDVLPPKAGGTASTGKTHLITNFFAGKTGNDKAHWLASAPQCWEAISPISKLPSRSCHCYISSISAMIPM